MTEASDGCLARPGHQKEAGALIYLVEELGDARLRCDQLLRYLAEAVKLIEKSSHKDHFFEVAGHLIQNIPDVAFRLQKALQAVALAADRLDYEEIKQELRPEKVEELERVLKDVRIRPVQHRSFPPAPVGVSPMKPMQAAARLREIAKKAREEGSIPLHELTAFIHELEPKRQAADTSSAVDMLDKLAAHLEQNEKQPISRTQLATVLSRIGMEAEFNDQLRQASKNQDKTALSGEPVLIESFELIRAQAILGSRAATGGRWRTAIFSLFNIVDAIGTVLVQLGSLDTQKSEALKRELRQVMPQARKIVEDAQPGMVMAFNEEIVPIDSEMVTESLDRILTSARMALVSAGQENWKKVLYHTVGALDGVGVVGTSFGVDGIGMLTRVRKSFIQKSGARPMLNLAGDEGADRVAAEADISKLYQEMSAHLDTFDMAWSRYERDPVKNRDKLADALRYMKALHSVAAIVIRNLEKKSGEKTANASEEARRSRFEEGVPADPTENMDPEDAKAWKVEHEENKDNFKSAAVKWVEKDDSKGRRWVADANGDTFDAAHIHEIKGPGIPLYVLKFILKDGTPIQQRKEFKKLDDAKKAAETWMKSDEDKASLLLKDFKKLSSDDKRTKFEEGKPADPTENMSPEDAKKWKVEHLDNKDNFKASWVA